MQSLRVLACVLVLLLPPHSRTSAMSADAPRCEACHDALPAARRTRLTLHTGDRVAYCRACLVATAIPQGRLRSARMLEVRRACR